MKKKAFTLVELIAVITIIAIILLIAIPNVNKILKSQKQNAMLIDAKTIIRQIQYENKNFSTSTLANLGLEGIDFNNYDPIESYAYVRDNSIYLNLVGRNKFEGMYLCNVSSSTKTSNVSDTPCDEVHDPAIILELNGGTISPSLDAYYPVHSEVIIPNPVKEGYTFSGWEIVSGDGVLNGNVLTIGEEDTTLYATYQKVINMLIDLDGGTSSDTYNSTYTTGTTINLSIPRKASREFARWEIVTGNSIISGNRLTVGTEDTEVRAIYINCAAGTYNDGTSNSCTSCPGGTYSGIGQSSCTSCSSGTYSGSGAGSCTSCPAGTYSSAGASSCTDCSAGSGEGSETCSIVCGAGTYLPAGATSCSSCPAGKYCEGGQYTYGANAAQGITGDCPAGSYSAGGASAVTCTACATGSYSSAGSSSCTACQPSGTAGTNGTTSGTGQSSCNASCSKKNVSTWNTATWSTNSVINSCSIATCLEGYDLYNSNCINKVASNNVDGSITYYESLEEALNTGTTGTTTLLKDFTEDVEVNSNVNKTLNLDGKTLTGSLTNNGTLTISGNGTIIHTDTDAVYDYAVANFGTMTIENGTYRATQSNCNALQNKATGTLVINTGQYSSISNSLFSYGGNVTINNGNFTSRSSAIAMYDGVMTINNGTIGSEASEASTTVFVGNKGSAKLYIKGGSISSSTGNAVNVMSGGQCIISGGTLTSTATGHYPTVVSAGTGTHVTVTGGTITQTNGSSNCVWKNDGGTCSIQGGSVPRHNCNT